MFFFLLCIFFLLPDHAATEIMAYAINSRLHSTSLILLLHHIHQIDLFANGNFSAYTSSSAKINLYHTFGIQSDILAANSTREFSV